MIKFLALALMTGVISAWAVVASANNERDLAFDVPAGLRGGEALQLQLVFPGPVQDGCAAGLAPPSAAVRIRYCPDTRVRGNAVEMGARLVDAITLARLRYGNSIDFKAGIRLSGQGEGALQAITQSILLPNEWWRRSISRVEVEMPRTLPQNYIRHFREAAAAGRLNHVNYYFSGAAAEDGASLLQICEQHRISCTGSWGESKPRHFRPVQDVRLDKVLPVFTAATTNDWSENGNYNLGLGWDAAKAVHSDKWVIVPLRYKPPARRLGDQAGSVNFTVTLRRTGALAKRKGETIKWALEKTGQRGRAVVAEDGSVTIEDLTLAPGNDYTRLWIPLPPPDWKLVYTRQPRATRPVPGTPVQEAANWQHATDVGRINGGLAEADVVIDDLSGRVKVIHNCTESKEICVAHEARVSPDGTRIVYSVGRGNALHEVFANGLKMGIYEIPGLTEARLWVYDLRTGKKAPIPHHPHRAIDRQPDWLSNDRIVFSSNRGNTHPFKNQFSTHRGVDQFGRGRCFNAPYCVSQEYGYDLNSMSMQIWTMNIDGTDARNISPHENNALAPAVMSNGDILYSCWNSHENLSFDGKDRSANNPATSKNKWWLCRTDGNGADQTVILNGHKTTTLKTKEWLAPGVNGGEGRSVLRAIRSVAEIFDNKLAVSNYYRSNHVGSMGIIYGMEYGDPHVEGCSTARCYPDGESRSNRPGSGQYVPSSLYAITPYGTDQDLAVRRDARNRPMGKAGYAAPLPDTDSEFMMTHARGSCYEATPNEQANRAAMQGEPTCQKALYKVKVPIVTNPFDKRQMELLAGGERWQVFDGRAIATYQRLHGKPLPDQPEPLDPDGACYLQVVDARRAELAPAQPYNWRTNLYAQCAHQGCAVNTENPRFHERNMAYLTVLIAEMWDVTWQGQHREEFARSSNNMGHKSISVLGSQPLAEDGSVKMQVPCETPIIMTGTDRNGLSIAHDSMLHSLRRGETRTCHGCHDGHSEERARKLKRSAVARFRGTLSYGTSPPMPRAKPPITFADVEPILARRCSGCHQDMNNDDGLLYYRIAMDYEQHDWAWAPKQLGLGHNTAVEHAYIQSAGRGYRVGDRLVFKPGGARGEVSAVGPRGEVRQVRLVAGGQGYPPLSGVQVKSATGKGAWLGAMTDAYDLFRPYTSKWVAKFARDSLLYWKCMGARQDGRKDKKYDNDIDFGKPHKSGATRKECRIIGRWIDTGIQL